MGVQVKLLMGDPYNKRYLLRKPRNTVQGQGQGQARILMIWPGHYRVKGQGI